MRINTTLNKIMDPLEEVRKYAKENLDELRWLHTKDVVKIAISLAEKEGADKEIVEISAWLHDIGTSNKNANVIDHHIYSAEIARNLLKDSGLKEEKVEKITKCILEHMGPYKSEFLNAFLKAEGKDWSFLPRPSSIEAKVVYDADMLNLGGPFGVAKIIFLNAKQGKSFKESLEAARNLSQLAIGDLKTKSGKELGKKCFPESQGFLKNIDLEFE
jgi:putative nucleotidyltransferase with HDIG domain